MVKRNINRKNDRFKCNEEISSKFICLLDVEGNVIDKHMSIYSALEKAKEQGLDLVEISFQKRNSICKIIDFNKFLFEQKKKDKEKSKLLKTNNDLKTIQMHVGIEDNDLDRKCSQAKDFLLKGHAVKFSIFLRGREKNNLEVAYSLINRCLEKLRDTAIPEKKPILNGSNIEVFLKK